MATHPRSDPSSATPTWPRRTGCWPGRGARGFYSGRPGRRDRADRAGAAEAARKPTLPVPPGYLERSDLAAYRVIARQPTHVDYRGLDVYGMAPASSGGTTVGEALNILERYRLSGMSDADALHRYLEASALAFADRNAYVGDPAFVDPHVDDLLSAPFAAERACEIMPNHALRKPVDPGNVNRLRRRLPAADRPRRAAARHRERLDHQPDRERQVGQRRGVHAHDRADRRLRHRGARPWLPAQQRADRLHRRLRRGRPEPDRGRQAPALVDLADDRAPQRQAVPGGRVARRLHDHHHRAADPVQPASTAG